MGRTRSWKHERKLQVSSSITLFQKFSLKSKTKSKTKSCFSFGSTKFYRLCSFGVQGLQLNLGYWSYTDLSDLSLYCSFLRLQKRGEKRDRKRSIVYWVSRVGKWKSSVLRALISRHHCPAKWFLLGTSFFSLAFSSTNLGEETKKKGKVFTKSGRFSEKGFFTTFFRSFFGT